MIHLDPPENMKKLKTFWYFQGASTGGKHWEEMG